MKKILVVIDTNVLVSAAYNLRNYDTEEASKRHCNVLLEKPAAGEIIPVVNELIVSEYQRKLAEEKFSFSSTLQEQIINSVLTYALNLDNPREVEERLPDPSDTIFYKVITDLCGSYADSYLTTGNLKHFPLQARNLNIVVNPKTLLMILDDYKNINTCLDRINYLNQNGWQMITENIAVVRTASEVLREHLETELHLKCYLKGSDFYLFKIPSDLVFPELFSENTQVFASYEDCFEGKPMNEKAFKERFHFP